VLLESTLQLLLSGKTERSSEKNTMREGADAAAAGQGAAAGPSAPDPPHPGPNPSVSRHAEAPPLVFVLVSIADLRVGVHLVRRRHRVRHRALRLFPADGRAGAGRRDGTAAVGAAVSSAAYG
jgi:hypothetical protein